MAAEHITVGNGTRTYQSIADAIAHFNSKNFAADGAPSSITIYPEGAGTNGEWTGLSQLNGPTGCTADASGYLIVKGSAGLSFGDADPLRYNTAKGVALTGAVHYGGLIGDAWPDYTRFQDLQVWNTSNTTAQALQIYATTAGYNSDIRVIRCILVSNSGQTVFSDSASGKFRSTLDTCLLYPGIVSQVLNNWNLVSCTVYGSAFGSYSMFGGTFSEVGNDCISNLVFENTATKSFESGQTWNGTARNCGTNDTYGPATGLVTDLVVDGGGGTKDTFYSVTGGSEDFRVKSTATAVTGAGYAAGGSYSSTDIRGATRSASPTIGCWQAPSGGTVQSLMQISG